jgi:hypothetical protein
MSGWFAMRRGVAEHPLFDGDMARLGAWTWLIAHACWKPTPYDIQGRIVTLERGQLCVSYRQLADAWGWSKSAVERFLTRLKTEAMIETETGTGRAVITICNYARYQDLSDDGGTVTGTPTGTAAGQQRDTKEQGNKERKERTMANAMDGEPSQGDADEPFEPVDLKAVLFGTGLAYLTRHGTPERQARSMLGKWRKQFGDGAVVDALHAAQSEAASDPIPMINRILERRHTHGNADRPGQRMATAAHGPQPVYRRQPGWELFQALRAVPGGLEADEGADERDGGNWDHLALPKRH